MSNKNNDKAYRELTLLQKLERAREQRNLERFSNESTKWFRNKVRTLGGQKTRDELLDQQKKRGFALQRDPGSGFVYQFVYDAKHKDTLPYWDAFPLIIAVGPAKGGFYGLNLHYLPPKMRAVFFDQILANLSNQRYTNKTKLNITYNMLKNASQLKMFKPMFKHYLSAHVASRIVKIPSREWEAALYLPTSNFQKSVNSKVWMDSSKYK